MAMGDSKTRTFAALRLVVINCLGYHATQRVDASLDADAAGMASGTLTLASASDRQVKSGSGGGGGGLKGLAAAADGKVRRPSKGEKRAVRVALAAREAEGTPAPPSGVGTGAPAELSKTLNELKTALAAFKGGREGQGRRRQEQRQG